MVEPGAEDRGPEIVAVSSALIALATVAVTLRFWSRFVGKKAGLWWDDWLSLAALVRSILLRLATVLNLGLSRSLLSGQSVA